MSCPVAIALGANLGDAQATLIAVRPLLEQVLGNWWSAPSTIPQGHGFRWSPLYRTEPVGGPPAQRDYLNAALLLAASGEGDEPQADPLQLLRQLQDLELHFGRRRLERWGPRQLDLDLLWCGGCRLDSAELVLPHPRMFERRFVLTPLAAIAPDLIPPVQNVATRPRRLDELLAALPLAAGERLPEALPGRPGWPE